MVTIPNSSKGEGEENHLLLKVVSKVEQLLEEESELMKLDRHGSTGPPLPSLALQAKKRSRWRHQAAVDQSTSYNFSSSHHSSVSLSQIDQKLLSGRSHLSSFSCALLLRIGHRSGCGWLPSCSSMALTLLNHKLVYIITGVHQRDTKSLPKRS